MRNHTNRRGKTGERVSVKATLLAAGVPESMIDEQDVIVPAVILREGNRIPVTTLMRLHRQGKLSVISVDGGRRLAFP